MPNPLLPPVDDPAWRVIADHARLACNGVLAYWKEHLKGQPLDYFPGFASLVGTLSIYRTYGILKDQPGREIADGFLKEALEGSLQTILQEFRPGIKITVEFPP